MQTCIGTDIVQVNRFIRWQHTHKQSLVPFFDFECRQLRTRVHGTPHSTNTAGAQFLASRFAVKEAFTKH